ncbi:cholecystokinin receptor type A-like [Cydia splendana]|uniref:cholecystokinin receptor type A-like n=1 Tax=Cydia splendana TaxID=1100963 RepID=UPI00300CA20D
MTYIYNVSHLYERPTAATALDLARNVTRNVTRNVSSNAYEWRFILPPYILIFTLSISGNCMVIATLANNKRMRTVTDVYLLNLAISDFLLGVFCVPFTLVGQIYRRFLFGPFLCRIIPFLQAVSVSVDVWTLVAISLERYFAICRPLKSRKWQTQCHAYKMIGLVWLLSVMLNLPILIVSTLQPMRGNAYKCREVWPSLELERAFNLGLDAALLLIPIFVMVFAYSLIVTKLWRGMQHEIKHNFKLQRQLSEKSSGRDTGSNSNEICCKNGSVKKKDKDTNVVKELLKSTHNMNTVDLDFRHAIRSTHTEKSIEAKRKVIRMLFVIILEFFICWTPLHVINTIYLFYPKELYKYVGSKGIITLQLLAYCSSFSNPITYCFMNHRFRQDFLCLIKNCKLFRNCFDKKPECTQPTPPPSSQEIAPCVIRGTHTGRSDLEGQEGEECV